ncbi:MAG: hypothetical protein JXX28_17815 [Deltaproteobacteria bacterium]|nr:hypothetical protein [Deltaproteobacteria bacterium]
MATRCVRCFTRRGAQLAEELTAAGHPVRADTVLRLLREMGFTMQKSRESLAGSRHEVRDAQLQHIHALTQQFRDAGQPVTSVDTKKRERGGEWPPHVTPPA